MAFDYKCALTKPTFIQKESFFFFMVKKKEVILLSSQMQLLGNKDFHNLIFYKQDNVPLLRIEKTKCHQNTKTEL